MQEILAVVPGIVCLMDDILIHAKSQEEHNISLKMVLIRLQAAVLTLNTDKCQFSKSSLKSFGHIIDDQESDQTQTSAIQRITQPTCVSDSILRVG